jgi:hypothetical protein
MGNSFAYQKLGGSAEQKEWLFFAVGIFFLCIIGFSFTFARCQHAPPTIKTSCPSNGTCNAGTITIVRYQPCADNVKETWCQRLHCDTCAEYLVNCGLDTAQAQEGKCVPLQAKSLGWCGDRYVSLIFVIIFGTGIFISMIMLGLWFI